MQRYLWLQHHHLGSCPLGSHQSGCGKSSVAGSDPGEQRRSQIKSRRPVNLLDHGDINYWNLQDFKSTFNNTLLLMCSLFNNAL